MSSAKYSVGIIGCGGTGKWHAEVWRRLGSTTVDAAVDLHPPTLASFCDRWDVSGYDSHQDMLSEEDPDIVSICTWHSTHADLAIDACEQGIDGIVLEKPMATSLGETRDILDAADRNGVAIIVSHQRRHDPLHQTLKDAIDDGTIGDVQLVRVAQDSGLLNWGSHVIDLARFILRDPAPVWTTAHVERATDRHERGMPIEDNCSANVAFEGGPRLIVEMDLPAPDATAAELHVVGDSGVAELTLGETCRVVSADGISEHPRPDDADPRAEMTREFVEMLDGERDAHPCSAAEASVTMEIMMGVYESARRRTVVEHPMQTLANPLAEMIDEGYQPTHPGAYDIRIPYQHTKGGSD